MKDRVEPDETVAQSSSEAALDAGMAAAFEPDSAAAIPAGASVLRALGAVLPQVPHVRLRDSAGGQEPPVHRVQPGAMPQDADVAGRYQWHGEIARGGMGMVLLGRDVDLGREVAVKVLLQTHRGKTELLQRFVEEAQIGGQLQHPGVVPVYELGRLPDQRPYFTMKLVKGRTLAKLLAERQEPQQDRLRWLRIFEQVCETLAYAHARGVIHRDLKPSNVMVGAFGEVQVMDWGLAKVLPEGGVADEQAAQQTEATAIRTVRSEGSDTPGGLGSQTHAGSVMGTPAYMAPEQALGQVDQLDARCDVFGLGAILCEILTGKPPYVGACSEEVYGKAKQADLAECFGRLDACGADSELIELTRRCLSAEREGRPRNAEVLAVELTAYRESVEQRLRQAELARVEAQARAVEERKRRRVQLALAASVLLTLLLAGGGWLWMVEDRAAREREALARRAETERTVGLALGQAEQLQRQAGQSDPETLAAAEQNLALWRQAMAAVGQAEAAIAAGDAGPQTQDRVAGLRGKLEEGIRAGEETRRLARLLTDLDEARLSRSNPGVGNRMYNDKAAAAAYERAFSAFGLDVMKLSPEEVIGRLRTIEPRARVALALAFDYWAACMQRGPGAPAKVPSPKSAGGQPVAASDTSGVAARLTRVAAALDDDPWRQRFRKATERAELESLAKEAMTRELPAVSLSLLVDALVRAEAKEVALQALRRGVLLHPADFYIHWRLAEQLADPEEKRQEVVQEALGHAWAAVAARPQSANAYHLLGCCLGHAGRTKDAVDVYYKAIALDPKSEFAYNNLGAELCDRQGDAKGAVAAFQKAIELDPNFAGFHRNLANALTNLGDKKGAAAALRKSIELDATDARAHAVLSQTLFSLGETDGGMAAARRAIELDPKFAVMYNNLGLELYKRGGVKEAVELFRKGIEADPKIRDLHMHLATALIDLEDMKGAAAACRRAIQLDPSQAGAHQVLSIALISLGEIDEAVAEARKAVELDDKMAVAHHALGAALHRKRDGQGAVAACRRAIQLDPGQAGARQELIAALMSLGEIDEAVTEARKAVELEPRAARAYNILGCALNEKRDWQGAAAAFRKAIELEPNRPLFYANLANVCRCSGDMKGMAAALRKRVELLPGNAQAYVDLSYALDRAGDTEEAIAAARKAIELDPTNAMAYMNLGKSLYAQGDVAGSVAASRKAVELDPSDATAHTNLAAGLFDQEDLEGAVAESRKAVELNAKYLQGHRVLGVALRRQGRFAEAEAAFRRAAEQCARHNPSSAKTLEAEANLCARIGKMQDRLPGLFSGQEQPRDHAERSDLARACFHTGRNNQAVRLFTEVLDADSRMPADEKSALRREAAQAAILAGCRYGTDVAGLSENERARLRQQAMDWLRADLASWTKQLADARPEQRAGVRSAIGHWHNETRSNVVLRPKDLATFGADEQEAWKKLWEDVDELHRKVQAAP